MKKKWNYILTINYYSSMSIGPGSKQLLDEYDLEAWVVCECFYNTSRAVDVSTEAYKELFTILARKLFDY